MLQTELGYHRILKAFVYLTVVTMCVMAEAGQSHTDDAIIESTVDVFCVLNYKTDGTTSRSASFKVYVDEQRQC